MLKPDLKNTNTIAAAEREVADLEQERRSIVGKLDEASANGDVDAILRLRSLSEELPVRILAGRLKLERLRLEDVTKRLPAAAQAANAAIEAGMVTRQAIRDAKAAHEAQFQASHPIKEAYNKLIRETEDRKARIAEIEGLLYRNGTALGQPKSTNQGMVFLNGRSNLFA